MPIWSSEIEPFAIRVTEKRLPQVQHFGNISGLHGAKLPPVDIITFGSPCQDMSIAGKRTGLNGSRSSLFHEAIRIIREMRCASNGKYPRYIVWENVPGAFSSNGGEDFRCVLEAICSVKDSSISIPRPAGKWTKAGEILAESYSLAWRVLDAQYWCTRTVPSPLSLRDISPHCGESPSDSNSIFPALVPSKSATRKIRFLRWGRFPHGVGEMSALADKGGRHGSCVRVFCGEPPCVAKNCRKCCGQLWNGRLVLV